MARVIKQEYQVTDKGSSTIKNASNNINKDLDKVERKTKNVTDSMQISWKKVIGVLGVLGVTGALKNLMTETINYADELHKLNLRLGVNVKEMDKLRKIGELSGVEFRTLAMSLQRMTRRLEDASKSGGPVADAIGELGLNVEELLKLSPDQAFVKIGDALGKVESNSQKVAIAFKLFDSEGVKVVQMTENLDENMKKMNSNMDEEKAAAAAAFNDQITTLKNTLKDLAMNILPLLNQTLSAMMDPKGKLRKDMEDFFDFTENRMNRLKRQGIFKTLWNDIKEAHGIASGQNDIYDTGDQTGISFKVPEQPPTIDLGSKPKVESNIYTSSGTDKSGSLKEKTKKQYSEINKMNKALHEAQIQLAFDAKMEIVQNRLKAESEAVDQELELFFGSLDEKEAAIKEHNENIKREAEAFEELKKQQMEHINYTFSAGLTDNLFDFIEGTKSAKEAFLDFAATFLKQIAMMIIKQQIMNALKKAQESNVGGIIASTITSLVSSKDGNVIQGGIQSFAKGGIANGPTLSLIGDNPSRREAVIPLPDGRNVPVKMNGGQGVNITNNITIEGGASGDEKKMTKMFQEMGRIMKEQVRSVMRDEMRVGGMLNTSISRRVS